MQACSLLFIPPPAERVAPQGGFPTDLAEINLLGGAALVQDMEGWTAKVCNEHEGYSATDFSDAYTHLSATFTLPELTSNPVSAASAAAK